MSENEAVKFDTSEVAREKVFAELKKELKNKGYSAGLIDKDEMRWVLRNTFGDIIAIFVFGVRLQTVNPLKEYSIRYGVPLIFVGVQNDRVKHFKYIKLKFVEDGSWHEIDFMLVFPKYSAKYPISANAGLIQQAQRLARDTAWVVAGWVIWIVIRFWLSVKMNCTCGTATTPDIDISLALAVGVYLVPRLYLIHIQKNDIADIERQKQNDESKLK